jgi:CheY-like chemotaxis protein
MIFTPFSQISDHGKKYPSSGLGLVICKKVIIKLGGTIEFTSSTEGNHGTTFTITLPLEKVANSAYSPEMSEEWDTHKQQFIKSMKIERDYITVYQEHDDNWKLSNRRESLPTIKIADSKKRFRKRINELSSPASDIADSPPDVDVLLAEDDRIIKNVLSRLLSSRGYRVITFINGKELIDHVERTQREKTSFITREIVVSDYHMPIIDGLEAAKRLKEMKPDIKVILLTANAFLQNEQLQYVDKLLMKPVQGVEVDRAIRELLQLS